MNLEIIKYNVWNMLIGHLLQSSSEKLLLNFNLKTEGSGLGAGLPHSHCLLIGISASLSIAQGASHLAVLGQVEGGDLLGLLDLLVVGLHLALELVNQGLHPLVVLPVLISSED